MTPPQRLHSVGNSLSKKVIPVTCDPDGRLERRPLADLTPFQGNLKDLDDARYAKLKASILAEGFMAPVFMWQDKILDGHQRTTVLNGEGWDVEGGVPVIEIQADTEADAARKLLKLTSAYGKPVAEGVFDFMQAHELDIGDLADVDLPDFDEDALLAMLGEGDPQEEPTDDIPEPPVTPVTRTGDLWHMGKHRVLCGDSTSAEAVDAVLISTPGLVVTDPPYGIDYQGGQANEKKRPRLQGDTSTDLYASALALAGERMATGAWYVWFADSKGEAVYKAISDLGFEVRALLIWNKLKAHYGAPSAHYCQRHEPCLYAVRGSAVWSGASNEATVWDIVQPSRNEFHPTEKPVECMARPIRNHGVAGDIVYDPFLGSGTTLVAAHSEGRVCYGMEIDPAYVDVSVTRWQEYTNQEAILDGDGRTFAEVKAERLSGEDVPTAEAAG